MGNDQSALVAGYTSLGRGVTYRHENAGPAVLIAYGGYTARSADTEGWADALVSAKLAALGVGHVYAVKGPKDASYASREIANSKLVQHLVGPIADGAPFILVVAHSSGAFVAHELLGQLNDAGDVGALGKVVYADLDGGGSGLTQTIVGQLRRALFVWAEDTSLTSGRSHNAAAEISLGETYSPAAASFGVQLSGSGCHDGARWCLHDLLITHRPHDPDHFDLADDYTDFSGRPVTTEYLDELASALQPAN